MIHLNINVLRAIAHDKAFGDGNQKIRPLLLRYKFCDELQVMMDFDQYEYYLPDLFFVKHFDDKYTGRLYASM